MTTRTPRCPERAAGFTLLELMVAIAILVLLLSIGISAIGNHTESVRRKRTATLIAAIENALAAYFADFRTYPPDGLDAEPGFDVNADGVLLPRIAPGSFTAAPPGGPTDRRKNGACLIYFLMLRHTRASRLGASGNAGAIVGQTRLVGPYLPVASLRADLFSRHLPDGSPDLADPACELLDAWGHPLEYDRIRLAGELQSRDGDPTRFHADAALLGLVGDLIAIGPKDRCPSGDHPLAETLAGGRDPRRPVLEDGDGCRDLAAPVRSLNVGSYDLWARGPSWANPRDDIGR